MSAPGELEKEAQTINVSFLCVGAYGAIQKLLSDEDLDAQELAALGRGAAFFRDVAHGIAAVQNEPQAQDVQQDVHAFDLARSFEALDYAMAPLERLQGSIADEQMSAYFKAVGDTLLAASEGDGLSQQQRNLLEFARGFFGMLYELLHSTLTKAHVREQFGAEKWRFAAAQ